MSAHDPKRTLTLHMSAYDPKRTLVAIIHGGALAYDF